MIPDNILLILLLGLIIFIFSFYLYERYERKSFDKWSFIQKKIKKLNELNGHTEDLTNVLDSSHLKDKSILPRASSAEIKYMYLHDTRKDYLN